MAGVGGTGNTAQPTLVSLLSDTPSQQPPCPLSEPSSSNSTGHLSILHGFPTANKIKSYLFSSALENSLQSCPSSIFSDSISPVLRLTPFTIQSHGKGVPCRWTGCKFPCRLPGSRCFAETLSFSNTHVTPHLSCLVRTFPASQGGRAHPCWQTGLPSLRLFSVCCDALLCCGNLFPTPKDEPES